MDTCNDLDEVPSSCVETMTKHNICFSTAENFYNEIDNKFINIDVVKYSAGTEIDAVNKRCEHLPSSSIIIKEDADEVTNMREVISNQELVAINKHLIPHEDLPLGSESFSVSHQSQIYNLDEHQLCYELETNPLNMKANLQTQVTNTKKEDNKAVIPIPAYNCTQEPIKSHVLPNRPRADCRVIFSTRGNCCLLNGSTISDVASKCPPINNNVSHTVNKENEYVIESDEVERYSPDIILPLSKSCGAIDHNNKRKTNISFRGRRVSFPEDDNCLITSYLEPANPWQAMSNVSKDDIIKTYRAACETHGTSVLPTVLQQLSALPLLVGGRVQCFNLKNQKLDYNQCECLEEVFRRVQFRVLNFESCGLDDDSANALFDMIEFYDSTIQLNIACNAGIGSRGWQICAKMLKKSPSIAFLDAHDTNLCEQTVPILARVLRLDTKLQTLHLENCNLTERPLATLSGALRVNDALKELFLADNHIGPKDCIHLENLLAANSVLKVLDLSSNNIQDEGCKCLCQGLQVQQENIGKNTDPNKATGLVNLILWNNHLTYASASPISMLISMRSSIQSLNVGKNSLTSEGMLSFQSYLLRNKCITDFGLQATKIEDEGVIALAECLAGNSILKRIDLRDNNITLAGLSALASVLGNVNKTVVKIDLDDHTNISGEEKALYTSMQRSISESCRKNHTYSHSVTDLQHLNYDPYPKRVSLDCEVLLGAIELKRCQSPEKIVYPSPTPILCPAKGRFRVRKISEKNLSIDPTSTLVLSSSAPASLMIPTNISRS